MNIDIINIHVTKEHGDNYLYIGRSPHSQEHYGNPFTHLQSGTWVTVKVATREESVQCYEDWLRGAAWHKVEPLRRLWILSRIDDMATRDEDLTFGCFCKPQFCHGDVLAKLILEVRQARQTF